MPNIQGINIDPEVGLTIYDKRGNAHIFTNAEIEDYLLSHNVEKTEQWLVDKANSLIFARENDQCALKILSVSPLDYQFRVAVKNYPSFENGEWVTKQYEIPDGWWL
jgi:hypothetical protein